MKVDLAFTVRWLELTRNIIAVREYKQSLGQFQEQFGEHRLRDIPCNSFTLEYIQLSNHNLKKI